MWRRRQVSLLLPMLVVVAAASGNTPPSSILDCGESCGQDGNNLCIPSQQCKMKVSVKPGEECQAPCTCCRLRPACTTHTTKSCSRYQGGQCKSSCKLNERVTAGKCKEGSTCQCCAEPCKAKKLCTNAQGFCVQDRKDCASGKIKTKGCKGYGCLCCIPKSCTSYTTTSCLMYEGGHCKSSCGQNERVTSAICNEGNTCKCCAKPCKSKKLCTQVNGFCVQDKNDCGNGTLNMRGCQGYGCLCCIPKRGLVTTAKLSLLTTAVRTVTIPPTPPKQPTTTEITIITQIPSSTEGESKEELTTEEATTDAPSTVSLSTKVLSTDVQSEVPYTIVSTEIPSKASSTELPTAEVITEKDSSTEVTIDIPQTENLTTEYVTNVPSAVEPSTEITINRRNNRNIIKRSTINRNAFNRSTVNCSINNSNTNNRSAVNSRNNRSAVKRNRSTANRRNRSELNRKKRSELSRRNNRSELSRKNRSNDNRSNHRSTNRSTLNICSNSRRMNNRISTDVPTSVATTEVPIREVLTKTSIKEAATGSKTKVHQQKCHKRKHH
nr:uncharacterized protein LOC128690873 [Cherax quadricarinatus]